MTTDFRLSTSYPSHPKLQKLERRLGAGAVLCHLALLAWTAENRPKGALLNMTPEDVEIAARWSGKEGLFVDTLLELRLLDREGETLSVHDWQEHNPWVAEAPGRQAFAKRQNHRRWHVERGSLEPETCALCRFESPADRSEPDERPKPDQSTDVSTDLTSDATEISRASVTESSFPFLSNSKSFETKKATRQTRKTRQTRLEEGWQPKESTREWARSKHPSVDFEAELEAFSDWHIGKGSTWVDWDKALQGWIRRASSRSPQSQRIPVRSGAVPAAAPVVTELAEYLARGAK